MIAASTCMSRMIWFVPSICMYTPMGFRVCVIAFLGGCVIVFLGGITTCTLFLFRGCNCDIGVVLTTAALFQDALQPHHHHQSSVTRHTNQGLQVVEQATTVLNSAADAYLVFDCRYLTWPARCQAWQDSQRVSVNSGRSYSSSRRLHAMALKST